jgi:hypothetical protein
MSFYGLHQANIEYLVCSDCGDEAFTWMAGIFACPTCGGEAYVYPDFENTHEHRADDDEVGRDGTQRLNMAMEWEAMVSRKRKRRASDEG